VSINALSDFVRPMYQDLDGVDRFDTVERIGRIARMLHPPTRELELLILFSGLVKWLDKPRNLSRTLLTRHVTEDELRNTIAALHRLEQPQTDAECAVAAATLIDSAGVRGLAERFAHARREGLSIEDVAREEPPQIPPWMDARARTLMIERIAEREKFCRAVLVECGGLPPT
jgi:hypothetical protein